MNIVSFSFFRTPCPRRRAVEYYTQHWPALFRHFPEVYPGWRMRWHVDEREVDLVAPCLEGLDFVDIEIMPRTDHMSVGHLWRAKPCWDPDVEYCAQNDCDAVPAPREALCRQEFLDTGYDAHVIRDSPDHTGQMMCGLCCWRAAAVRELWPTWDAFIADHERHDRFY